MPRWRWRGAFGGGSDEEEEKEEEPGNGGTFRECEQLTAITLPSTLRVIGSNCFKGCTKLKQVTFPASLEKLGFGTFEGCASLEAVDFTAVSSLKKIGSDAFAGIPPLDHNKLKRVDLPEGLRAAMAAFHGTTYGSASRLRCADQL